MITDIFHYSFLLHSLEAGILLGILGPLVGLFLVVRRYSLLADTLAHVSLLGIALAAIFQIPLFFGAFAAALVGGLGMERLRLSNRVVSDATLAVFFSGSLALALIILSLQANMNVNLISYLFGSIATVTIQDLVILFILLLLALLFFFFLYRKLFLIAVDEDLARASGISVALLNTLFMLLASAVVAGSIHVVGVLLIGALMVIPVLAAMQWRLSFLWTLSSSVFISEIAVIFGFFFAYGAGFPAGATIVVFSLVLFAFSFLFNYRRA